MCENKFFADRIKMLRESKNLQQKELAKQLNIATSTYNNYEKGIREPDYIFLKTIANYFNVTTDFLLGLTDDPKLKILKGSDLPEELKDKIEMIETYAEKLTSEEIEFALKLASKMKKTK